MYVIVNINAPEFIAIYGGPTTLRENAQEYFTFEEAKEEAALNGPEWCAMKADEVE